MINKLNELNSVEIKSLKDKSFKTYGKIHTEFDVSDLVSYMENNTDIPQQGNIYLPSVEQMEDFPICSVLKNAVYGGMDIQIGYCNGKNSTYNGFEYHKGSEINIEIGRASCRERV